MLRKIKAIFPETSDLNNQLLSIGFENVQVIPNFKYFENLNLISEERPKHLVFFSRINKKKGLNFIFDLIKELSNEMEVYVDFYGPINEDDRSFFFNELNKCNNTQYCGTLNGEEIIPVLSSYTLLLFPTQYFTEGLPGVILDAYAAQLPVVATKWQFADEFIEEGKTGIITNWEDTDDFIRKVKDLLNNPNKINFMRNHLRMNPNKYSVDSIWLKIKKNGF